MYAHTHTHIRHTHTHTHTCACTNMYTDRCACTLYTIDYAVTSDAGKLFKILPGKAHCNIKSEASTNTTLTSYSTEIAIKLTFGAHY